MIHEDDENRVILEVEEKRVILEDVVWEWIILKQFSKEKHPKKKSRITIFSPLNVILALIRAEKCNSRSN